MTSLNNVTYKPFVDPATKFDKNTAPSPEKNVSTGSKKLSVKDIQAIIQLAKNGGAEINVTAPEFKLEGKRYLLLYQNEHLKLLEQSQNVKDAWVEVDSLERVLLPLVGNEVEVTPNDVLAKINKVLGQSGQEIAENVKLSYNSLVSTPYKSMVLLMLMLMDVMLDSVYLVNAKKAELVANTADFFNLLSSLQLQQRVEGLKNIEESVKAFTEKSTLFRDQKISASLKEAFMAVAGETLGAVVSAHGLKSQKNNPAAKARDEINNHKLTQNKMDELTKDLKLPELDRAKLDKIKALDNGNPSGKFSQEVKKLEEAHDKCKNALDKLGELSTPGDRENAIKSYESAYEEYKVANANVVKMVEEHLDVSGLRNQIDAKQKEIKEKEQAIINNDSKSAEYNSKEFVAGYRKGPGKLQAQKEKLIRDVDGLKQEITDLENTIKQRTDQLAKEDFGLIKTEQFEQCKNENEVLFGKQDKLIKEFFSEALMETKKTNKKMKELGLLEKFPKLDKGSLDSLVNNAQGDRKVQLEKSVKEIKQAYEGCIDSLNKLNRVSTPQEREKLIESFETSYGKYKESIKNNSQISKLSILDSQFQKLDLKINSIIKKQTKLNNDLFEKAPLAKVLADSSQLSRNSSYMVQREISASKTENNLHDSRIRIDVWKQVIRAVVDLAKAEFTELLRINAQSDFEIGTKTIDGNKEAIQLILSAIEEFCRNIIKQIDEIIGQLDHDGREILNQLRHVCESTAGIVAGITGQRG